MSSKTDEHILKAYRSSNEVRVFQLSSASPCGRYNIGRTVRGFCDVTKDYLRLRLHFARTESPRSARSRDILHRTQPCLATSTGLESLAHRIYTYQQHVNGQRWQQYHAAVESGLPHPSACKLQHIQLTKSGQVGMSIDPADKTTHLTQGVGSRALPDSLERYPRRTNENDVKHHGMSSPIKAEVTGGRPR